MTGGTRKTKESPWFSHEPPVWSLPGANKDGPVPLSSCARVCAGKRKCLNSIRILCHSDTDATQSIFEELVESLWETGK